MSERVETDPSLKEVRTVLESYIGREYTLQIVGNCKVSYSGRAQSKLDKGDRLVIKKQDSAFLVHGPENYQPKNWQPEVDKWEVEENGDELVCRSIRNNPHEEVELVFYEVEFLAVTKLVDDSKLMVSGHEVDIHEAIEENPEIVEEGLRVISRERKTPAGYIDVLAEDEDSSFLVIEVKRNPDYNTVLQLERYVEEIRNEFSKDVRGMIFAPDISEEVLGYLDERNLEFAEVDMDEIVSDFELSSEQSELDRFK